MKRLTLTGSTTVITGAASGMGAAIARLLARRRVHLALIDHNAEGSRPSPPNSGVPPSPRTSSICATTTPSSPRPTRSPQRIRA